MHFWLCGGGGGGGTPLLTDFKKYNGFGGYPSPYLLIKKKIKKKNK
jgi:hypothetical protein